MLICIPNCVQDTISKEIIIEENYKPIETNTGETVGNGQQMFDELIQKMRDIIKSD